MSSRLVILISGSGTNLQAIIDAVTSGVIPHTTICLVISNRKNAFGLQRARLSNIETAYLNLIPYDKRYPSTDPAVKHGVAAREAYDTDLAKKVLDAMPDMVVMAGFMHVLSNAFLAPLAEANVPILNLHPALPGEYDGAMAIERAYEDSQKGILRRTGVMIHHVTEIVDHGSPVVVEEVSINSDDKLEDLQARIHAVEHRLIIKAIKVVLEK
ncbi:MAG: hypothetical protein LQ342_000350 [Letrouitia transgressa]|nr:MAG: hypothetical protein LQ342_000350 [Letrouitia transgressa]